MGLFYKISRKELLQLRHQLFIGKGIPALQQNGFQKSPFDSSLYGRNNLGDYTYTFCRLSNDHLLEITTVHISRTDRWIKTFLNIFAPQPFLQSLGQLQGRQGMQYSLPPNTISEMRLGSDDIAGIPLFNYRFLFKQHKLKRFFTKAGMNRRTRQLGKLLESDYKNIEYFVKRWHDLYVPLKTDWEGIKISQEAEPVSR